MTEPWFEIPLRARDGSIRAWARLDVADYRRFGKHRWCLHGAGYAARNKGNKVVVLLHRELLGLGRGDRRQVDHQNRDKLDNRRANLRLADQRVNSRNTSSRTGASSKYRGVTGREGRWIAQAGKRDESGHDQMHYLGKFDDEQDAAAAAAQWRAENLPGTIENPELLRRAVS